MKLQANIPCYIVRIPGLEGRVCMTVRHAGNVVVRPELRAMGLRPLAPIMCPDAWEVNARWAIGPFHVTGACLRPIAGPDVDTSDRQESNLDADLRLRLTMTRPA